MHSVRAATIAATTGLLIALPTREALADHTCDGVRLELSENLTTEWRDAGQQLRTELVGSDAPCVSALLRVDPIAGGVRLSATSADGRHTERMLKHVAALIPTAIGIVASLPPESRTPARETIAPRPAPETVDTADVPSRLAPDPSPQAWLGVSLGARIGAPTLLGMMDVGGRMSIEWNRWLFVASFRYATSFGESAVAADDSYYEVVGGVGLGRRFSVGASSLDVVLLPSLSSASLNDNDDDDGPPAPSRIAGRVGASVTWWTAFKDGSRVTLTADTDVAPYGLFYGVRTQSNEPLMPAWTTGISLGAAGKIL